MRLSWLSYLIKGFKNVFTLNIYLSQMLVAKFIKFFFFRYFPESISGIDESLPIKMFWAF